MTLIDCLYACNPWWKMQTAWPGLSAGRSRSEFTRLVQCLDGSEPVALVGPRGTGKTTLLFQTVQYLVRLHVPPVRILYFSGDDPALFIHRLRAQDVVFSYCTGVLHEEPETLSAPVYVLVDAADRVHGLRLFAHRCRARGLPLRFLAAAPSVPLLFPAGSEALLAKTRVLYVPPLRLPQFRNFFCAREGGRDTGEQMPNADLFRRPGAYVRGLMEHRPAFSALRAERTAALREYLLVGGYPAYFNAPDRAEWQRRLYADVLDAWLYSDLLCSYSVRDPEQLKYLLYYIASLDGREQAYAVAGKYLSLNTVTVMNHMQLLEQGGMAAVCEHYTRNRAGVLRKNKRFFLCDCGVKHALLHRPSLTPADVQAAGRDAVLAMLFDRARERHGQVWYWRGNGGQILYVLETEDVLLPVLFSLSEVPGRRQTGALRAFCRACGCGPGLVVTEDTLDLQDGVCMLPLWLI